MKTEAKLEKRNCYQTISNTDKDALFIPKERKPTRILKSVIRKRIKTKKRAFLKSRKSQKTRFLKFIPLIYNSQFIISLRCLKGVL
jgi:hypothetical protein